MLLVVRVFSLIIFATVAHFGDGLAFPALVAAALIGWRGIGFYWLAAPILALAFAANYMYSGVHSTAKEFAALGNIPFELMVFSFLSMVGYLLGWLFRRRGSFFAPRE
ncbi:hypothetical protein [uncultured Rhodoblastus sp.]|uniref:hypothetical protein n=1 Tax=uncultured Rhodoblastus sp. TaxID=543037 RepID=UPI0025ECF247|nr:hypothetical protein [uncultured Rhodoblastus sp.]